MRVDTCQERNGTKLQYIDCLRGIAILMVIVTHADKYIPGMLLPVQLLADYGQMGVQLFFIVSAVTLCLTFDRNDSEKAIGKFYIRRYFRIAPLYYFGILMYLLYFSLVEPMFLGSQSTLNENYTVRNIMSNLLLVNDFTPGPANNKIVPGGWSIGTETTFYALFPFIFLFYRRFRYNKKALLLIPFFAAACCFIMVQLVMATVGMSIKNNTFLYFHIICQLPVFLMGISIYFWLKNHADTYHIKPYFYGIAFAVSSIFSLLVFRYTKQMAFFIPIMAGTSFVFLFMLFKTMSTFKLNWLSRMGQLSYSIYLFHFIFAWQGSKWLTHWLQGTLSVELIFLSTILLTIGLSMIFAVLSEKYIEKPGIELGRKLIEYRESRRKESLAKQPKTQLILKKT